MRKLVKSRNVVSGAYPCVHIVSLGDIMIFFFFVVDRSPHFAHSKFLDRCPIRRSSHVNFETIIVQVGTTDQLIQLKNA